MNTINVEVDQDNLVAGGTHVMGLFDAGGNVTHLQVETDAKRVSLESRGESADGSYWECLTGKSIANFLATRGAGLLAHRPGTITLQFRQAGGAFVRAD